MATAMLKAILDAYLAGRLTAQVANEWLATAGLNLTVGVE